MKMTLKDFTARFPGRRAPIPAEFAGEWIAWSENQRAIFAHGADMDGVYDRVIASGCNRPILQKMPRGPFVGGI